MTLDTRPPRLGRLLLRLARLGDRREEIEADLLQVYETCAAEHGRTRAAWRYCADAVSLWTYRLGSAANGPARHAGNGYSSAEWRFALRRLRAHPVATVASIVMLGTSMGAAAVTWSLLSAVLLHPLPVRAPETLAVVGLRYNGAQSTRTTNTHTYPLYPAVRSTEVFDSLAAGGDWTSMVQANGITQPRSIFFASLDYFSTLGVSLPLGRGFTADDDRRGAPLTAVLSDRLWHLAFAANPDALGQELRVQGRPVQVVGVAPSAFRGLNLAQAPDLYMPLHTIVDAGSTMSNPFDEPNANYSPTAWVTLVGRLRPGITSTQAADRLTGLTLALANGATFVLTPVNTAAIPAAARPEMTEFTRLLSAAVGLLLLIGCLSVGMLLLIRTEARRDEFAMCLALGATRMRLARSVVVDGVLLASAGALLALPISHWLFTSVRAFELPGHISLDLLALSTDGRVLLSVTTAALAATLVIAVVAGAFGVSADVAEALRARAGATPRVRRRRTRATLVTIQVAVAVLLMSGAGLLARSLTRALHLNPGYETSHLITSGVDLGASGYNANRAATFFAAFREALSIRPAIRSFSLISPQGGMGGGGRLIIDGESRGMPSFTEFVGIDDQYFSTMGLRLLRGRDFTRDDVDGAPLVAIVSDSLGRFVARGGDPLGHRIAEFMHRQDQPADAIEIVGVVPDVVTRVTELAPLMLYRPLGQRLGQQAAGTSATIVLHAAGRPDLAIQALMGASRQLDPQVVLWPARTMDEQLLTQMAPQQFGMLVLASLGAIAVLLTVLGTSVLAETMAQMRQREMSIRAALGATGRQIAGVVLAETARSVGAGLILGLGLTWLSASTIRVFLFQIQPLDPVTLGVVTMGVLGLALVVSLRPALRVAHVDLAPLLREE